jgi:CheY-like chemotaxis protein
MQTIAKSFHSWQKILWSGCGERQARGPSMNSCATRRFPVDSIAQRGHPAFVADSRQSFRVLLIDDAPAMLPAIRAALQDVCEVRAAENGEAGTQVALQWRPDVIICDMLMPGINGLETITRIRANEETRFTPIILLSGAAEELTNYPTLRDAVACVIAKPFEVGWLRANVAALLPGGGAFNFASRANPRE